LENKYICRRTNERTRTRTRTTANTVGHTRRNGQNEQNTQKITHKRTRHLPPIINPILDVPTCDGRPKLISSLSFSIIVIPDPIIEYSAIVIAATKPKKTYLPWHYLNLIPLTMTIDNESIINPIIIIDHILSDNIILVPLFNPSN
jgi:hypothetical protein